MPKITKENLDKELEKNQKTKTVAKKSSKSVAESKSKKATSKNTTTKTKTSTKSTASDKKKKQTTKSKAINTKKSKAPIPVMEYYDLPYRYNQTLVKILAQTPQMLFVYWDISDEDRNMFLSKYGDDFFTKTKPVLLVHNETQNHTFEIEINDFANSWYLQVNNANCKYKIELGRRPNNYVESPIKEDYIYITSSNEIDAPNDHILFEKFNPDVTYQNIKTGKSSTKNFGNLSNYKNMKQIYHIYDLYKDIYKNELFEEMLNNNLNNPSSGTSSSFK